MLYDSGYFTVGKSKLMRVLTWFAVCGVLGSAWVAELWFHEHMLSILLGFTACVFSAYAAVRHMRCYLGRLASLIRFAHDLDASDVDAHMGKLYAMRSDEGPSPGHPNGR